MIPKTLVAVLVHVKLMCSFLFSRCILLKYHQIYKKVELFDLTFMDIWTSRRLWHKEVFRFDIFTSNLYKVLHAWHTESKEKWWKFCLRFYLMSKWVPERRGKLENLCNSVFQNTRRLRLRQRRIKLCLQATLTSDRGRTTKRK